MEDPKITSIDLHGNRYWFDPLGSSRGFAFLKRAFKIAGPAIAVVLDGTDVNVTLLSLVGGDKDAMDKIGKATAKGSDSIFQAIARAIAVGLEGADDVNHLIRELIATCRVQINCTGKE